MSFQEPVFYMSSGQLRFDVAAWKRNQDFRITSALHSMSLNRLKLYLQDMAEAEAERNAAVGTEPARSDPVPQSDMAIVSSCRAPRAQRRVTPAQYVEGGRSMIHWDLVEYTQTLDNLTDDITLAMVRSRRFAVVCVAVKMVQLVLLPAAQYPRFSYIMTLLAAYHTGFALTYLSSLSIVSRSRRGSEALRQKIKDRTVFHEDVQAWAGLLYQATNWIAESRDERRILYGPLPLVVSLLVAGGDEVGLFLESLMFGWIYENKTKAVL